MPRSFNTYWTLLGTYLRPQLHRVVLLALLLFSSIGLQLLNPQIIRYVIDAAQHSSGGPLAWAGLAFIAAALAERAARQGALYVGEQTGWVATNALRRDLARHCLRLDMAFHKAHTPGELIERIDGDVTALSEFFAQFAVWLLGNTVLIIAILALLFREDWRVGVGLSIYALVTLVVLGRLQNLGMRRWTAYRQAEAELFGFLEERIGGTEDIRANGAEAYTLNQLDTLMEQALVSNRAARLAGNLAFVSTNFLFVLGYSLGLALGAYLYLQGSVSLGSAFMIVYYIGMLAAPLESMREQAQQLQQARASIGRIRELFAYQPRVAEQVRATLPAGALGLACAGVVFSYDDAIVPTGHEAANGAVERALDTVTFTLAPGQVLGLLGRTGSGKTTLTRLLLRLYDPQQGTICLGGVHLPELALADLRARVGVVTQDVQLFSASIRNNLALFDRTISDVQIEQALTELGLLEWVRSLPHGLDTRLGAGGLGLSAGEAQLLAFARVFLRDPGLVILDEASSRLDPVTERLLERAVGRLLAGRTALIIAHRLATVQRADQIMILERGQIAELGARLTLAADPGSRFTGLLRTGLEEVLA
mgnify:CR=1 FL=1